MSGFIMKTATIDYYDKNASTYADSTIHTDMGVSRERFLALLKPGARILDFGCGSGRDTNYFLEQGFDVCAADGSEQMCRVASANTGIAVKHMYFLQLDDREMYDGIWACASILHLKRDELPEMLQKIRNALRPDGVFYTSFKYGAFEGERDGRYFTYLTEETLSELMRTVNGFRVTQQWISDDALPKQRHERWLNVLMSVEK